MSIYESKNPDQWERFRCKSLLGITLADQKKYSEAEKLLIDGYQGMLQRRAKIPAFSQDSLVDSGKAIVQMYERWEKQDKAAEWRRKIKGTLHGPILLSNHGLAGRIAVRFRCGRARYPLAVMTSNLGSVTVFSPTAE